jgi:hypothetical protein
VNWRLLKLFGTENRKSNHPLKRIMPRLAAQLGRTAVKKEISALYESGKRGIEQRKVKRKAVSLPNLPASLLASYRNQCIFFLAPTAIGILLGVACGYAGVFFMGLTVSILCFLPLYFGQISKILKEGYDEYVGIIEGYIYLRGLKGIIARGEDALNPLRKTRNVAGYKVKFEDGALHDITVPTTNAPFAVGTTVKLYVLKNAGASAVTNPVFFIE